MIPHCENYQAGDFPDASDAYPASGPGLLGSCTVKNADGSYVVFDVTMPTDPADVQKVARENADYACYEMRRLGGARADQRTSVVSLIAHGAAITTDAVQGSRDRFGDPADLDAAKNALGGDLRELTC